MDNSSSLKISSEFLPPTETQFYLELVSKYLNGVDITKEDIQKLPIELRILIKNRILIRIGKFNRASKNFVKMAKHPSTFVQGESNVLLGFIYFQQKNYLHALNAYQLAQKCFQGSQFINKSLLARFNEAQCLLKLDRREEGYEIENYFSVLAEEAGLFYVAGNCIRSKAYQTMRQGSFPLAKDLFFKSRTNFLAAHSLSDAAISFGYEILLRLVLGESSRGLLDEMKSQFPKVINARSEKFHHSIHQILSGVTNLTHFDELDEEMQNAIQFLFKDFKVTIKENVKNSTSELGMQLIQLLKLSPDGLSPEKCIEHIWGSKGRSDSLKKRLWTLIYRINKRQKIVFLSKDGKYFIS